VSDGNFEERLFFFTCAKDGLQTTKIHWGGSTSTRSSQGDLKTGYEKEKVKRETFRWEFFRRKTMTGALRERDFHSTLGAFVPRKKEKVHDV